MSWKFLVLGITVKSFELIENISTDLIYTLLP